MNNTLFQLSGMVTAMFNLMVADLYKLRKSLGYKILLAITSICAIAVAAFAYAVQQGQLAGDMAGIGFMFSDVNVISILGAVLASIFICGDFDNKTVHGAISAGISRSSIVFSKAVVYGIAAACLLLPYIIVTAVALSTPQQFNMGSVAVGFLNILTSHSSMDFTAADIGKLVLVMLATLMTYIAQLSICIPLAFVLRKPVLIVAIYYGFTIVAAQFSSWRGNSLAFDRIYGLTPFGGDHVFLTVADGVGKIFQTYAVSIVFIAIMLVISYSLFRKAEIK